MRMPEISRFFGIVIRMYCFDHDPPHFHAKYGESEAQCRIRRRWRQEIHVKRITHVRVVAGHEVELTFTDGSVGLVDLSPWIAHRTGVFGALRDPSIFAQVSVDADAGTIVWPNGADLCPDVLADAARITSSAAASAG